MKLVLDTSVLIDHLRGDQRAVNLLSQAVQDGHELWSVTVVRTEILAGMRRAEQQATFALLDILFWQEIDKKIADKAGELAREYLKSHSGVDTVDYLIAAAVIELEGQLLTQNIRHFPMFTNIKAAYSYHPSANAV